MTRRRKAEAGFTLIETLVALALTALAALILAAAIRSHGDSLARVERHQERAEAFREAGHFLRRALGDVSALGLIRRGRLELFFVGEEQRLTLPLETERGVSIATLDLADGRLRISALPPPFQGAPRADAAEQAVLLEGVREWRLAYHDGSRWLRAWDSRERLPRAVRIEIAFQDGTSWPALVAELPLVNAW